MNFTSNLTFDASSSKRLVGYVEPKTKSVVALVQSSAASKLVAAKLILVPSRSDICGRMSLVHRFFIAFDASTSEVRSSQPPTFLKL